MVTSAAERSVMFLSKRDLASARCAATADGGRSTGDTRTRIDESHHGVRVVTVLLGAAAEVDASSRATWLAAAIGPVNDDDEILDIKLETLALTLNRRWHTHTPG